MSSADESSDKKPAAAGLDEGTDTNPAAAARLDKLRLALKELQKKLQELLEKTALPSVDKIDLLKTFLSFSVELPRLQAIMIELENEIKQEELDVQDTPTVQGFTRQETAASLEPIPKKARKGEQKRSSASQNWPWQPNGPWQKWSSASQNWPWQPNGTWQKRPSVQKWHRKVTSKSLSGLEPIAS
jgi:hypothetical protein